MAGYWIADILFLRPNQQNIERSIGIRYLDGKTCWNSLEFSLSTVLFGLLSILAITGITSLKSWMISFEPHHSLAVCSVLIIAGLIMYIAGKISKGGLNRH